MGFVFCHLTLDLAVHACHVSIMMPKNYSVNHSTTVDARVIPTNLRNREPVKNSVLEVTI